VITALAKLAGASTGCFQLTIRRRDLETRWPVAAAALERVGMAKVEAHWGTTAAAVLIAPLLGAWMLHWTKADMERWEKSAC